METWYGQNVNAVYNYNDGTVNEEGANVDDFTAMLWKGATKVGIGFAAGIEDIGI